MTDPLHLEGFFVGTRGSPLGGWHTALRQALAQQGPAHGKEGEWQAALAGINLPPTRDLDLTQGCVRIGSAGEAQRALAPQLDFPPTSDPTADLLHQTFCQQTASDLKARLKALCPWRKGPFNFYGIHIDAEWRSDWKWQRLKPHITPLAGRLALDVGCGNGYYLLRMLGEGARLALGVDPSRLFSHQFRLIKRSAHLPGAHLLPLRSEQLPALGCMDTVFSMGVLYHRPSPEAHLRELIGFLRPGGEVVLETLIVPGSKRQALKPRGRYAQMPNVHCIPSVPCLTAWLQATGFVDIRTVDITRTVPAEQRATEWMPGHSLQDFLDPQDPSKTIEGHPAPTRAICIAQKPPPP